MATLGESSSAPPKSTDDKPVIVRVKRKTFQSPLDAFWLEINERPLKRPLLDFENLSISDSAEKGEFKTKKVLVQHVETLSSSEKTIDIVQSFVESSFADVSEGERKGEERRLTFKKGNKQDQLLSKARQEQEGVEDRRIWDVRFIREFNDWEMDEGFHFLRILGANTPPMDVGDRMRWKLKPNGDFDIRSYYNKLRDSPSIVFPWKAIWKARAPRSIPDLLFGWCNWLGKYLSQIWNLVPLCILWCIWKERNRRTFEDLDSSGDQMLASFSGTLFDWSRAWGLMTSGSLPSFLSSLSLYHFSYIFIISFEKYTKMFHVQMSSFVKCILGNKGRSIIFWVLAKNARFEQIWRSRKGNQEAMHNKELDEMCRFYDVVRVDVEERSEEVKQQEDISLEDHMLLSSYLPLLREMIPSAASEIESDLHASMSKQAADDYVYDFYAVRDDMDVVHEEASYPFPIVQVDEEDYYDGPDESEYETDDSNAENNPLNDYPDEISEEEEEEKSEASENESGELESESGSDKSLESEDLDNHGLSNDADLYDDDIADDDISDGDYFDVDDDDDDDDGKDWR
uniref:RNA-directed DNA methylation 4 n=1 Tax=Quercus lobata TaxID=97700 RepID=A0A7N2KNL6_QUELO